MNTKRKRLSDADILKVFTDLGIETEKARERFRRMSRTQPLDVWGTKRWNEPIITRDDNVTEAID